MPRSRERRHHRFIKVQVPEDRGPLDPARRYGAGAALIRVRHRAADAKGQALHVATAERLDPGTPVRHGSIGRVPTQCRHAASQR